MMWGRVNPLEPLLSDSPVLHILTAGLLIRKPLQVWCAEGLRLKSLRQLSGFEVVSQFPHVGATSEFNMTAGHAVSVFVSKNAACERASLCLARLALTGSFKHCHQNPRVSNAKGLVMYRQPHIPIFRTSRLNI